MSTETQMFICFFILGEYLNNGIHEVTLFLKPCKLILSIWYGWNRRFKLFPLLVSDPFFRPIR